MASITCPACGAVNSEQAKTCAQCGMSFSSGLKKQAPIQFAGGKLQVAGTVILAGGIIATVVGSWWGPALLFPGIVLFVLGRFW